jgi:tubulin-specific chaperone A
MAPSQLQIKTNALGRLLKESNLYQKEVEEQQARVDNLKANSADEYEIKKAVGVNGFFYFLFKLTTNYVTD